jgi:hypothetical protein
MHHDTSLDAPPTSFIKPHAKYKHEGGSQGLFCRNIMEAYEAREYGSDSKRKHQVEGAIMQAKEWTRTLGRCTRSQSNKHECTREEPSQEEEGGKSPIQLFVRVL